MAALGRLLISLAAETAEFTAPLSKAAMHAQMQAEKMQNAISGAAKAAAVATGALASGAAAGFLAAAKSQADFLVASQRSAEAVGVTTDKFIGLAGSAGQFGLEADEMAEVLQVLSVEAAEGGEKLKKLGVSIHDSNGELKSADQLLKDTSSAFRGLAPGVEKTAAAASLFGEDMGRKVIPMLNEGAGALLEIEQRAIMFSGAMSDEAAGATQEFGAAIDVVQEAGQGLMTRFLAAVMPKIADFADGIADWISNSENFYSVLSKVNDGIRIAVIAVTLLKNAFGLVWDVASRVFGGIYGLVSNAAQSLMKLSDLDFSGAVDSAVAARKSITGAVTGIADDVGGRFKSVASEVNSAMSTEFVSLAPSIEKAATKGIKTPVERVIESVGGSGAKKAKASIDRVAQQIEASLSDIDKRLATFSLSDTEKELFDLKALGASPEQLSRAEEGLKKLEAMAASKEASEKAASDAADYRNKLEDEATRIIEDQKDAVQLLADAEARLLELQNAGLITSEQRAKEFEKMRASLDAEYIAAQKHYDDMKSLAEGAAGDMEGALSDFLVKPSKDGFKDMLTSWADTLQQMVAKAAAAKIIDALGLGPNGDLVKTITGFLSGGSSSKSGGGLGDIFGSIGSAVMGFFGAPAGSKAGGGPVMHGRPYVVGENGPEIMIPGTSGAIVPNAALATLSGGKSVTTVNNISVSAPNGRLSRESLQQLQASLGRTMNRSLARNT